ncbi:Hypothetical protein D9617_12g035720 [Elsinoe fawcettii]|nr:Hypothetical protein D9617_12g035720 [Elsinoe fawcettii]
MNSNFRYDKISKATFDKLLKQYPSTIPDKLKELDQKRLHDIPEALEKRQNSKAGPHLTKDEVVTLVKWKLGQSYTFSFFPSISPALSPFSPTPPPLPSTKTQTLQPIFNPPYRSHGTFRPRLLSLASSNTTIPTTTHEAFALLPSPPIPTSSALAALKHLTVLSGIGPATASLLLSTLHPEHLPFFSDELFRWVTFADEGPKGKGWERKIGYTVKEYEVLLGRVGKVRERLGVGAREVEGVAYVLGRTGGKGFDGEEDGGGVKDKEEGEEIKGAEGVAGREDDEGEIEVEASEKSKAKALGTGIGKALSGKKKKQTAKPAKAEDDAELGSRRRSKRLKTGN